jgi:WD40 repeat protein
LQVTQLVVGDEGGGLSVHSISDRKQLNTVEAHKHRVKSVSFISIREEHFLASASSDGEIKLWNCKVIISHFCCKPYHLCFFYLFIISVASIGLYTYKEIQYLKPGHIST